MAERSTEPELLPESLRLLSAYERAAALLLHLLGTKRALERISEREDSPELDAARHALQDCFFHVEAATAVINTKLDLLTEAARRAGEK